MKANKAGIDSKQFKVNLNSREGVKLQVLSDPVPYSIEHKSKWQIVNWWRKLRGTYYEEGYEYTVKIIKEGEE